MKYVVYVENGFGAFAEKALNTKEEAERYIKENENTLNEDENFFILEGVRDWALELVY